MRDRPGRGRIRDLAGSSALVAVLAACGVDPGGWTTECALVLHSSRLEVRLDDSWSDPDEYGVAVSCVGTAESCGLVRDGTIRLVPAPEPTTVPPGPNDRPEPVEPAPEPTGPDVPEEPSAGAWTGSALDGPVETIRVRVVDLRSGDVVIEHEVQPEWHASGDEVPECGGPSVAEVEVSSPRT
ncbi:hypothetical protein [Cellulosimicrobium sp. NPDC057862]|uniref:hypothetical protein n=1 Tax=Cellulosimicrobium sp. NPDC057862 TaxID=3346266 RepID=UPI00366D09A2